MNPKIRQGWFPAAKRGETTRECERCGRGYEPASRTQKRCPKCRKEGK